MPQFELGLKLKKGLNCVHCNFAGLGDL